MTKQIRISEDVHTKLKVYVARNKKNMVQFADKAIMDALALTKKWQELKSKK